MSLGYFIIAAALFVFFWLLCLCKIAQRRPGE